jgi:hypothetical protein
MAYKRKQGKKGRLSDKNINKNIKIKDAKREKKKIEKHAVMTKNTTKESRI